LQSFGYLFSFRIYKKLAGLLQLVASFIYLLLAHSGSGGYVIGKDVVVGAIGKNDR